MSREYNIYELKNGFRIVTCPMPSMESVSVGVWIGVGGRDESLRQQGISHFIEHLLFKGTKNRTALQITKEIEGVGGQLNAYTSEEFTCYLVKVCAKHQNLALDVLFDMVINPSFIPEEIEKERYVIKEEIHMVLDHPSHYVNEVVRELMWPDHPLGRMLTGTEKSMSSIKRDELVNFRRNNYFPKNMILCVAGKIDEESLVKNTERYISRLKNYKKRPLNMFRPGKAKKNLEIIKKETEQTHVCLGVRAVKRTDPDRYVLKILSTILGGNMSSRLFQIIREKHGLAYDIHSSTSYFKDTGGLVISAGIKSTKFEKFIELVLKELAAIKNKKVSHSELNRAKEYYQGQLVLGFEKTMSRMLWVGEHLLSTGYVPTMKEVLEQVRRVTSGDIIRVADKCINKSNISIAAIGPLDKDKRLELKV